MKNEMKNEQAVSPVIATILMVAITVVLAGVLYVWANSLAADQPESGTRNSYTATDATASTSAADDDTLMRITWQQASIDLSWVDVVVTLTIGDSTFSCSTSGAQDCTIAQDGSDDTLWETGEFLTISENGEDIASGPTDIVIYIAHAGAQLSGTTSVAVA